MTLCTMRIELNIRTHALTNVDSRERKSWLGEKMSSLQRRMEIPGEMEGNGAKNINCVNNNTIVHVVQNDDLRLFRPSCNIFAYKQYY